MPAATHRLNRCVEQVASAALGPEELRASGVGFNLSA